ncbi:MAG: transcription antitermination factor NusB [Alphaproteobacteria bacterium]|nr:transcription antitermination factor NusB [Alphaproteobacteria bacterium]
MSAKGKQPKRARRSAARLAAVQTLYELDLSRRPAVSVIDEFIRKGGKADLDESGVSADIPFYEALVTGVVKRREDLDRMIDSCLGAGKSVERMETVLRGVLRAGAYELAFSSEVDAPVAISEYVGVADAFFGGGEPAIVNGVLDRLAKTVREKGAAGADGGADLGLDPEPEAAAEPAP